MLRATVCVALLCLAAPHAARAEDAEDEVPVRAPESDCDGCREHPEVPRFPGFYINEARASDFEEESFVVGESRDGSEIIKTLGGRFWHLEFWKKEKARTPGIAEILKNYENAVKRSGGVKVSSSTYVSVFRMPLGKGERYLRVFVYNEGEGYALTILEPAALKQQIEFSASEMLEAIDRDGFIALHGIAFDTGKETVRPDSEATLSEVVSLLETNPALKLSIEGHTDNVGQPKANLDLSKRRADSVRKWLVSKGISASRLGSTGFGDTKPVADNRTEPGRAQNRRVELVKK